MLTPIKQCCFIIVLPRQFCWGCISEVKFHTNMWTLRFGLMSNPSCQPKQSVFDYLGMRLNIHSTVFLQEVTICCVKSTRGEWFYFQNIDFGSSITGTYWTKQHKWCYKISNYSWQKWSIGNNLRWLVWCTEMMRYHHLSSSLYM